MSFRSYIPRAPIHRPTESSRMVSPRSPNAVGQAWKRQRDDIGRQNKTDATLSQLRRQVERIPAQRKTTNNMFPFKIYQFPPWMRLHNNDDDWRRIKVRNGGLTWPNTNFLGYPWSSSGSCLGTDLVSDPYSDAILQGDGQSPPKTNAAVVPGYFQAWNEFVVPKKGGPFYIYISLCLTTAQFSGDAYGGQRFSVCIGEVEGKSTILADGSTFTDPYMDANFTVTDDAYHILLGQVQVGTNPLLGTSTNQLVINQFREGYIEWPNIYGTDRNLAGDPPIGDSQILANHTGFYDSTRKYFVGDVVLRYSAKGGNAHGYLSQYIYDPPNGSIYQIYTLGTSMINVDPATNNPDPWFLISKSDLT